jgi:phospholipid N-methyltransferase
MFTLFLFMIMAHVSIREDKRELADKITVRFHSLEVLNRYDQLHSESKCSSHSQTFFICIIACLKYLQYPTR